MKKLIVYTLLTVLPLLLYAQKTKLKTQKYYKSDVNKAAYFVLKKNKNIKHGAYDAYYENGTTKESGQYSMNKRDGEWKTFHPDGRLKRVITFENGKKVKDEKVGIWYDYHERGAVITGFDYDKNEAIKPIIKVPVRYPALARENQIEGLVKIKIELNADCTVDDLSVVNGIGYGCDEVALESIQKLVEWTKKYSPDSCNDLDKIIPVRFSLE